MNISLKELFIVIRIISMAILFEAYDRWKINKIKKKK